MGDGAHVITVAALDPGVGAFGCDNVPLSGPLLEATASIGDTLGALLSGAEDFRVDATADAEDAAAGQG